MAPPSASETGRKFFQVDDANKMLPLLKLIVGDIVRQFATVNELRQRLSAVTPASNRRKATPDFYSEELAQSQAELEVEEGRLAALVEELTDLGVELKGPDGLCDFPSLRDGREVYLCWRLGEPEVSYWHELDAGFAGRRPLETATSGAGDHLR